VTEDQIGGLFCFSMVALVVAFVVALVWSSWRETVVSVTWRSEWWMVKRRCDPKPIAMRLYVVENDQWRESRGDTVVWVQGKRWWLIDDAGKLHHDDRVDAVLQADKERNRLKDLPPVPMH
jgi:hypothetical protein